MHGRLVIFAFIAFAGDDESARRAIAPFRSLATPLADMVKPGPYIGDVSARGSELSSNRRRPHDVRGFDRPATSARTIHDYLSKSDATMRVAQLRALGGAMARVPADATAFAHRSKPMLVNVAAFYQGDADREVRRAWVTEFAEDAATSRRRRVRRLPDRRRPGPHPLGVSRCNVGSPGEDQVDL